MGECTAFKAEIRIGKICGIVGTILTIDIFWARVLKQVPAFTYYFGALFKSENGL